MSKAGVPAESEAEQAELTVMFQDMGLSGETAAKAAEELHQDEARAMKFFIWCRNWGVT